MQERVLIIIHVYLQYGLVAGLRTGIQTFLPPGHVLFSSPGSQHCAGLTALPGLGSGG